MTQNDNLPQQKQDQDVLDANQPSDMSVEVAERVLSEKSGNDPGAPYMVTNAGETSLAFWFKKLIGFGGSFPPGVSYFALGIFGSVVISFSAPEGAYSETMPVMRLFIGGSIAAQVIGLVGENGRGKGKGN